MPDDERTRRRLGDATRSRIDGLASGWSLEAPVADPLVAPAATPDPSDTVDDDHPVAAEPRRKRPRTMPPPPPGSTARKALEEAIVETKSSEVPRLQLADVVTPPPAITPPKERVLATIPASAPKKPPTKPPPIPQRAKTSSSPPRTPDLEHTPPVIIDAALIEAHPSIATELAAGASGALQAAARSANPNLTGPVPIGEFDSGTHPVEDEKLRVAHAHATQQHHTADALLGIPAQPRTVVKETPISVLLDETAARIQIDTAKPVHDPSTTRFERGDPTTEGRDDATEIQAPSEHKAGGGGTLRTAAMLRRKRGAMGDARYVFTALLGLRAAKKELTTLEDRQVLRQTSRKRHLVTLGRTAVTAEALDHPALGKSREHLQTVEDERSKHAGAVAASDAELERVRRDREAKAKTFAAETAKTSQELAELAKKLEPLEKEAAAVRKRGATLRDQLRQIAKRVADTEALLSSIKGEKMDRANIQADIATLKADQKAIQRDEPVIAAEMDALEPRIAAIVAARADAEKAQAERVRSEAEDQRRTTELFEAIGAKRKVVERAAAEAEAARDAVLFDLGERLYVDRPTILGAQMSPIDQIDLEYGESARRINELREVIANIDRWKVARGAGMIFLVLAVVGAFTAWLFVMLA